MWISRRDNTSLPASRPRLKRSFTGSFRKRLTMSLNILAQRAWLLSSATLQTTFTQLLKMTAGGSTLAWRPNREMVAVAWVCSEFRNVSVWSAATSRSNPLLTAGPHCLSAFQFPKHMKKKKKQSEAKIRVLLVDDHAGMRDALRTFINSEPDLAVVAEAASGQTALDVFRRTTPDVVFMDGSMPGKNGIEATYELRQLQPAVRIIGLTLYESSTYLEDMIAAGAKGYVSKTAAPAKIAEAIRAVAAGRTYFNENIPRRFSASAHSQSVVDDLSADELAVLKRIANGQTNDEIASDLEITLPVVERRRTAAMKKLNVRSRAELARVAALLQW